MRSPLIVLGLLLMAGCAHGPKVTTAELRQQCDSDHYQACYELANRHRLGSYGVVIDRELARGLLQRSCDSGLSAACRALAAERKSGGLLREHKWLDLATTTRQLAVTARRRACLLTAPDKRGRECRMALRSNERLALCVSVVFDRRDASGKAWDSTPIANAPDIRVYVKGDGHSGGHRLEISGFKAHHCWKTFQPEERVRIHVSEQDVLSSHAKSAFSLEIELGNHKRWRGPGYAVNAEVLGAKQYESRLPGSSLRGCSYDLAACDARCKRCEAGETPCKHVQSSLRYGCKLSKSGHCNKVAQHLREGGCGFEPDRQALETFLSGACLSLSGPIETCKPAADLAFEHRQDPATIETTRKLLSRVCTTTYNRFDGCVQLGTLHEEGRLGPPGRDAQWARARFYYRFGCYAGEQQACTELARFYEEGLGVAKDLARATQLRQPHK